MAASGSNPSQDKGQPSGSPCPSDTPAARKRWRILVVEDNKADVYLIREAIKAAMLEADVDVVQDGEKALRYFEQVDRNDAAPCPALIILDINLPKKHGGEVLQELRRSRRCANARVLVVTSSDSTRDRNAMAKLGIEGYFRKPSEFEEFMGLGELVRSLLGASAPGTSTGASE